MQSPWDADYRNRQSELDDIRSERSTSAPPPDTNLLFSRHDGAAGRGLNTLFESRNRDGQPDDYLFVDSAGQGGRASVPASNEKPPPGFSPDLFSGSERLSSSIPRHLPMASNLKYGSLDRQAIGETIVRSQSAAPSFDGRLSVGPPPGLASRETPLASNRSGGDSYLEGALDKSRILQLGERRPASTGVIGEQQSSSPAVLSSLGLGSNPRNGAVRPAAKTLMDLIQEDFPPESPLESDVYVPNGTREDNYYHDRPRTTSPLSQHGRDAYFYQNRDELGGREGTNGLADPGRRYQMKGNDPYNSVPERSRPTPQYVAVDRGSRPPQGESRAQGSIYAPVPQQSRPQPLHPQPTQFEQPPGYTAQSPQVQHVQTQILPSGHTVYVNAPPPPYGYATVQYHPHSQQHHIVHQTVPASIPPHGEQYISVVPIQSAGAPVQGVGPGGTFAYWQPDGQNGPQTVTIVNAHGPGGVPVAVTRVGNPTAESPRQQQQQQPQQQQQQQSSNHSGRGKEKGGKSRRGGSTPSRRGDTKHQANAICSPLLEEFKSKKNRDWTIFEIKGHVVEFCQDQNGSRFIQQRLEIGEEGEKDVVMNEVLPAVRRLRNDVFGNYVVQKLLDFGTDKMKSDLRDSLQGEMLQLSLQMYGCRVVQKALETLDETDVPRLLTEFHNNVLSCIHDQNGNHVIQKCIEVMSEKAKESRAEGEEAKADFFSEQIDFIVDDVLGNVASLSCHPYGCRVLQRILEHCIEPKKSRALDEISKCHKTLLDDQYGNYVIQHVLQFGRRSDRDSVLEIVVENGLLLLSRQKFASNVVEKLLKYGTADQRRAVVREMLKAADERSGKILPEGSEGTSVVLLMVRDAYANYVVQTTLDVIPECEEKRLLLEELHAHSAELKNYTFAKHIVAKLGT